MFKSKGTRAVESIAESIEQYCRMRTKSDKVVAGLLADIENRLGGIDQSIIEVGLNHIALSKKKGVCKMIKGFVKPDGTVLASNMIIEGSNRTAAMMCYEMGLLLGVNDTGVVVRKIDGVEKPAPAKIVLTTPVTSTNINDIPDEPDQPADPKKDCHLLWYQKCLCDPGLTGVCVWSQDINVISCQACIEKYEQIAKGGLKSQNGAEKHPGAGIQPEE